MADLRIAIVAGETSGDALGAALITELKARAPGVQIRGVAGERMRAAGCEALADAHELAVMGIFEPLRQLPRLYRLRRRLLRELTAWQPQVFIGIDSPAFNLGLAKHFKAHGVRTVQYVSPQVWAWRQRRVHAIAARCDLVLCLLPFEPAFYERHAVHALFVGHPLADQIPLQIDRAAARAALGLAPTGPVVALLPGSRRSEVDGLAEPFLGAAALLAQRYANLQLLVPIANAIARRAFERALAREPAAATLPLTLLDGNARGALSAADATLVASGTAALEAMLCNCPMVVAYRVSAATALLVRSLRLVRLAHFSLPNLLADEPVAPEFFQESVQSAALAVALERTLEDVPRRQHLREKFQAVHESLRAGGAARAAEAVLELADCSKYHA